MLQKHSSLLFDGRKNLKVFVPLCGKTLDMKWLVDQDQEVVGLDGIRKPLEDFCTENKMAFDEEEAPALGQGCHVMKIKDSKLKLYLGDMLCLNKSVEGQFDCIWDRGSLVALDRKDVKKYVEVIKDVLKPGGKILVEAFEYDVSLFEGNPNHPPPYPVFETEVRLLYEPDCVVELVEKANRKLAGHDANLAYYIITKK